MPWCNTECFYNPVLLCDDECKGCGWFFPHGDNKPILNVRIGHKNKIPLTEEYVNRLCYHQLASETGCHGNQWFDQNKTLCSRGEAGELETQSLTLSLHNNEQIMKSKIILCQMYKTNSRLPKPLISADTTPTC